MSLDQGGEEEISGDGRRTLQDPLRMACRITLPPIWDLLAFPLAFVVLLLVATIYKMPDE
jgi:hypothetical protein